MRIRLSNKFALAVLAPLVMASLVACGGDDSTSANSNSSSTATSESADEEAAEEPAEEAAEGEEIDPAEFAQRLTAAAKSTKTAHTVMEIGAGDQTIKAEGDVDYAADPLAMKLVMNIPELGDGIEMLLVDGSMYMKMPGLSDGKYIKTETGDPSNPVGSLTDQMDPMAQFEVFEQAVTSVTFVGSEDIGGEDLDHYTMVLDGTKIPNQSGATMPDEVAYDVWIDGEDRPRQLSFDMSGTAMTMQISDFDKKVSIKAPKANQVMELPTP